MHSSAFLADKHMASVLTNPLLSKGAVPKKPELDVSTAKSELQKGADPLDLLERYEQKGFATLDVAYECVSSFRNKLSDLSYPDQVAKIQEHEAGKRSLQWLWRSEMFRSTDFIDKPAFLNSMVWLVMHEGLEDFLWQWLEMDMKFAERRSGHEITSEHKKNYLAYAWKGTLLGSMIDSALGIPHNQNRSADAAIEIYCRAMDLKRSASKSTEATHLKYLPLVPALVALTKRICRLGMPSLGTSLHAHDRLIEATRLSNFNMFARVQQAELLMFRPKDPSPDLAYDCLRRIWSDEATPTVADIRKHVESHNKATRWRFFAMAMRTAILLRAQGKELEASWVLSKVREQLSEFEGSIPKQIAELQAERPEHRPPKKQIGEQWTGDHVAFPSLT